MGLATGRSYINMFLGNLQGQFCRFFGEDIENLKTGEISESYIYPKINRQPKGMFHVKQFFIFQ